MTIPTFCMYGATENNDMTKFFKSLACPRQLGSTMVALSFFRAKELGRSRQLYTAPFYSRQKPREQYSQLMSKVFQPKHKRPILLAFFGGLFHSGSPIRVRHDLIVAVNATMHAHGSAWQLPRTIHTPWLVNILTSWAASPFLLTEMYLEAQYCLQPAGKHRASGPVCSYLSQFPLDLFRGPTRTCWLL